MRNLAARQVRLAAHSSVPGFQNPQARLLSNKTYYSPTDPDVRIPIKPSKARALNYRCSLAMDTAKGVINHVEADLADSRDSLHLPRLLAGPQLYDAPNHRAWQRPQSRRGQRAGPAEHGRTRL